MTIVQKSDPVYRYPQMVVADKLASVDRAVEETAERVASDPVTIVADKLTGWLQLLTGDGQCGAGGDHRAHALTRGEVLGVCLL